MKCYHLLSHVISLSSPRGRPNRLMDQLSNFVGRSSISISQTIWQRSAPSAETHVGEWLPRGDGEPAADSPDFGQRLKPFRKETSANFNKDESTAQKVETSSRLVRVAQQLRPKLSADREVLDARNSSVAAREAVLARNSSREANLVRQRVRITSKEVLEASRTPTERLPEESIALDDVEDIDTAASESRIVVQARVSNVSAVKAEPDAANVTQVMNAEILREHSRLRYRSNATANYLTLLKNRTLSATHRVAANRTESSTIPLSTEATLKLPEPSEPAWRRRIANRRKTDTTTVTATSMSVSVPTEGIVPPPSSNDIATTPQVSTTAVGTATLLPLINQAVPQNETFDTVTESVGIIDIEPSISEPLLPQTKAASGITPSALPVTKTFYKAVTQPTRTPQPSTTIFSATTTTSASKRPVDVSSRPTEAATTSRSRPVESSGLMEATFTRMAVNDRPLAPKNDQAAMNRSDGKLMTSTTATTASKPVVSSNDLGDILDRLVPTRDNSPYLESPVSKINHVLPSSSKNNRTHDAKTADLATPNNSTSPETSETSITNIYIVGVVAVFPVAGLILWLIRMRMNQQRSRLKEVDTSSESGFRKSRLQPLPLTPPKPGRMFYGVSDKEGLVPSTSRKSPWEFPRSHLRLQTLIGEGNFGQVWKAEAEDICGCEGTLLVAVKTVKDGASTKDKQELLREMKIMQQLGPHANVVALLGCCTEQEPFLLIMEYVMYGRLLTFLRDHRSQQSYYNYSSDAEALTSRDLTTFAYCVAKGMEYIASKGIVHRDLAARNVLVDHNKLCKVADFGLSRNVRDSGGEMYEQRVRGALPIRWMAPESLIHSIFTQKSDVWSFGILIWEIVTLGSTPYPGMEAREVMRKVKDGHRLERPHHCRPELYKLMSRCWNTDPSRRPDFSELRVELSRLLDDSKGCVDLDNFQDSIYMPLEAPSDESEKV